MTSTQPAVGELEDLARVQSFPLLGSRQDTSPSQAAILSAVDRDDRAGLLEAEKGRGDYKLPVCTLGPGGLSFNPRYEWNWKWGQAAVLPLTPLQPHGNSPRADTVGGGPVGQALRRRRCFAGPSIYFFCFFFFFFLSLRFYSFIPQREREEEEEEEQKERDKQSPC